MRQKGRRHQSRRDTCPKLRLPRAASSSNPEEGIGSKVVDHQEEQSESPERGPGTTHEHQPRRSRERETETMATIRPFQISHLVDWFWGWRPFFLLARFWCQRHLRVNPDTVHFPRFWGRRPLRERVKRAPSELLHPLGDSRSADGFLQVGSQLWILAGTELQLWLRGLHPLLYDLKGHEI